MRELDEKEQSAIAGGYSVAVPVGASQMFLTGDPVNPLAVTFGTPVEPNLVLPSQSGYWPRRTF